MLNQELTPELNKLVDKLLTGNQNLDDLIIKQFIFDTNLEKRVIGIYSFRDIYINFKFSLREYSIVHSQLIQPWENPQVDELMRLNGITLSALKQLILNVNTLLKTYTDETWSDTERKQALERQIVPYIQSAYDEESSIYKIYEVMQHDDDVFNTKKNHYLQTILDAMREAQVHQVINQNYPIITSLLELHKTLQNNLDYYTFKEKKKYLKKQIRNDENKAKKTLQKYVQQILDESENKEESLTTIRWMLHYFVYSKHNEDLYMIHSILGHKNKSATKLYQKLFLKDHSTGRKNDFILHQKTLEITYHHLEDDWYSLYENIIFKLKN